MTERQLQFRVGVFVIVATVAMIVMVFQFGNLQNHLRPEIQGEIRFRSAVGIAIGTPVRRNGVLIGSRDGRAFRRQARRPDCEALEIKDGVRLWPDGHVRLVSSLLGDSAIEFLPGHSAEIPQRRRHGRRGVGHRPAQHGRTNGAKRLDLLIDSFEKTSQEWQSVGHNLNQMLADKSGQSARRGGPRGRCPHRSHPHDEGHGSKRSQATSRLVGDPRTQENLHRTHGRVARPGRRNSADAGRRSRGRPEDGRESDQPERRHRPRSRSGASRWRRVSRTRWPIWILLSEQLTQFAKVINSRRRDDPQAGDRPADLRESRPLLGNRGPPAAKSRASHSRSANFQRQSRPPSRAAGSQRRPARQLGPQRPAARRRGLPAQPRQ